MMRIRVSRSMALTKGTLKTRGCQLHEAVTAAEAAATRRRRRRLCSRRPSLSSSCFFSAASLQRQQQQRAASSLSTTLSSSSSSSSSLSRRVSLPYRASTLSPLCTMTCESTQRTARDWNPPADNHCHGCHRRCCNFSTAVKSAAGTTAATADSHDGNNDNGSSQIKTKDGGGSRNSGTAATGAVGDADADTDGAVSPAQKVWRAIEEPTTDGQDGMIVSSESTVWTRAVGSADPQDLEDALTRIGKQEREGGRMRQSQLGVIREDPAEDMRLLIENYTVPALASALRDREDVLQLCASLLASNQLEKLSDTLRPFERRYVLLRRKRENNLDLTGNGFDTRSLEMLRKGLMGMPRRVSQAHQRRAGVVLPLCNVNGMPCILFEKRSLRVRAHPDEVCLPGGMVSSSNDHTIVATCLREMEEEIGGIRPEQVTVLGVLRCNWGEVHHLTGVAVTPVVCFIGEIGQADLKPNPDEVAECFTVPLASFLDRQRWIHREDFAPIFIGGPHIIWGLTGYIVERFVKDILARYNVQIDHD